MNNASKFQLSVREHGGTCCDGRKTAIFEQTWNFMLCVRGYDNQKLAEFLYDISVQNIRQQRPAKERSRVLNHETKSKVGVLNTRYASDGRW